MFVRHSASGEHYNPERERWGAWCDRCGQELHGFDIWREGFGPYMLGWFHEELDPSGKVSGKLLCKA